MPLVRTTVDVNMHFDRVTAEVNAHARRAVAVAATIGAQACNARGAQRGMPQASVEASRVTPDGWVASFVAPGMHQWFQNYGTLGNRRKALKQPARTSRTRAPGTGIQPLGHLDAGRTAGVRALKAELARGL